MPAAADVEAAGDDVAGLAVGAAGAEEAGADAVVAGGGAAVVEGAALCWGGVQADSRAFSLLVKVKPKCMWKAMLAKLPLPMWQA